MSLRMLYMSVLIGSVALLSGCTLNTVHLDSQSPLRNRSYVRANFSRHAFVLGTVTVDKGQIATARDHPLPSCAYLKLIRYELRRAFEKQGFASGIHPAYVVNVRVHQLHFISGTHLLGICKRCNPHNFYS
ncbi:MAG: hypothetical protein ACYCPA_05280 [Acidithiobacillus sp.]